MNLRYAATLIVGVFALLLVAVVLGGIIVTFGTYLLRFLDAART